LQVVNQHFIPSLLFKAIFAVTLEMKNGIKLPKLFGVTIFLTLCVSDCRKYL